MSAVGVIFSNIHDENIPELSRLRSMGSIPFGGRYRLIDFALSNMVNSGITTVGVITKNNYQSLMDHIGSGKEWDLARKDGGLMVLPPYNDEYESLYHTRLDALKGIIGFLNRRTEEYVVMSDCDGICKIDFSKVIAFHEEKQADITLVYHNEELVKSPYYITFDTNDAGRITDLQINANITGKANVYINIMVLNRQFLINIINNAITRGANSFGRDILAKSVDSMKLCGYEFKGYYAGMDSMAQYYKRNLEMLDSSIRDELFGARDIYTKVKDSAPSKYAETAEVKNSLISDGCVIEGKVENSILFRGVKIEKGAIVRNSIVMQDNVIGKGAQLNAVITDKNVVVRDRRVLSGTEDFPFFIPKGSMV